LVAQATVNAGNFPPGQTTTATSC